jgi:hypothetical protein
VVDSPQSVELNKSSLEAYVKLGAVPTAVDQRIAETTGRTLTEEVIVDYALTRLAWLGIRNIAEIDNHFRDHVEITIRFAGEFLTPSEKKDNKLPRGMSVFYLAYVLICSRPPEVVEQFIREAVDTDLEDQEADALAEALAKTWKKLSEEPR